MKLASAIRSSSNIIFGWQPASSYGATASASSYGLRMLFFFLIVDGRMQLGEWVRLNGRIVAQSKNPSNRI